MTSYMSNFRGSLFLSYVSSGDKIEQRLYSFLSLGNGWHYGQGCAPSPTSVVYALMVVNAMRTLGARTVEVFPGIDGSIMVSAYGQNVCVDVTALPSGSFSYVVDKDDCEIASSEAISLMDVIRAVKDAQWLKPASSDSSILNISAKKSKDFLQRHFGTTTTPEYQLFVNAA